MASENDERRATGSQQRSIYLPGWLRLKINTNINKSQQRLLLSRRDKFRHDLFQMIGLAVAVLPSPLPNPLRFLLKRFVVWHLQLLLVLMLMWELGSIGDGRESLFIQYPIHKVINAFIESDFTIPRFVCLVLSPIVYILAAKGVSLSSLFQKENSAVLPEGSME